MRLIDEATGEPPILKKGDHFSMQQTITITPDHIVQWPDALLVTGEEVLLCRVVQENVNDDSH